MRKDVKIGLALSLVVVIITGWYFTSGDKKEPSIPLAQASPAATASPAPVQPQPRRETVARPTPRPISTPAPQFTQRSTPVPATTTTRPPTATSGTIATTTSPGARPTAPSATASPTMATGATGSEMVGPPAGPTSGTVLPPPAPSSSWGTSKPTTLPGAGGDRPVAGAGSTVPGSAAGTLPPGAPAPGEEAAPESYTVKPGDTFAVLAELYYGSQRYAEALMKANPHVSGPTALRPGMVLKIPAKPQLATAAKPNATGTPAGASSGAKPAPGSPGQPQVASDGTRLYTVKPNDTFYGIAASQLGAQSRWKELFELNKDRVGGDPKGLRPGMVLRLPEAAPLQTPKAASASAPANTAVTAPTALTATQKEE